MLNGCVRSSELIEYAFHGIHGIVVATFVVLHQTLYVSRLVLVDLGVNLLDVDDGLELATFHDLFFEVDLNVVILFQKELR